MGRIPGSKNKKKKSSYKVSKTRSVLSPIEGSLSENPFEIKNDLVFTGTRGGNSALVTALLEQCVKLTPGDRRHSVNIPTTVAPVENAASNLFLALRRFCKDSGDKNLQKMVFTSKRIYSIDAKKQYLGTRIWRTL